MNQNSNLKLIQGDSFQVNVTLDNVDNLIIDSIIFSCSALGLCKKLEHDLNKWVFKLTSSETKNFPKFIGDYDLTIKFIDGNTTTVIYRNSIEVLPKTNDITLCNKI